jgi:hypothetical protein
MTTERLSERKRTKLALAMTSSGRTETARMRTTRVRNIVR